VIATKTIPLMMPYVAPGAADEVARVLGTRWIGQGPKVDEFERKFSAEIVGGRPSLAVGSCTDALHLAYLLAGIGPGDEVIAPVFTCTATNIPLLYCGAKIRFCDVEPGGLNMSAAHALKLITERTKALVVVHYGGAPVDPALFKLGVPVIEDCAQAIGTGWPGTRGDYGCFSFQAVKHVTTGDGGMLTLPQDKYAEAKRRRWFGIDREAKLAGIWANDITEIGFKYQLTDIGAVMGIAGLNSLPLQIEVRRALRALYMRRLEDLDGISVLDTDPDSACWLLTVAVEGREALIKKLSSEGIESGQVHYRNDRYSIFREFPGEFPNMDAIDGKYLVLPLHMGMDREDVERVCDVIRGGW
jgi:dTDP-4-amino-4,6-dideoxygalactose transaminase